MAVYFIQQGVRGPVKIGFATQVHSRLMALQTASPVPLILRLTLSGYRREEKLLHELFKNSRLSGEWFLAEAVEDFIQRCQTKEGHALLDHILSNRIEKPEEDPRSYVESLRWLLDFVLGRKYEPTAEELRQMEEREREAMQQRLEAAEREGRVIHCPASWED